MVWETGVQSQVESYKRLKKWYLIPICLTQRLSGAIKGIVYRPPLHHGGVAIEKRAFGLSSTKVAKFTYLFNFSDFGVFF